MKEKKLYTCEICHTDYAEKSRCAECEKSHKTKLEIKSLGEFKPFNTYHDGFPSSITVVAANGDEHTYYC